MKRLPTKCLYMLWLPSQSLMPTHSGRTSRSDYRLQNTRRQFIKVRSVEVTYRCAGSALCFGCLAPKVSAALHPRGWRIPTKASRIRHASSSPSSSTPGTLCLPAPLYSWLMSRFPQQNAHLRHRISAHTCAPSAEVLRAGHSPPPRNKELLCLQHVSQRLARPLPGNSSLPLRSCRGAEIAR